MSINKTATDPTLTEQDKNWELMSVLGMKWSETKELSEEDRDFLLTKVENIKLQIKRTAQPNDLLG
jgi:hypothetical protein